MHAAAQQQLGEDQASLDRLAKAHVIGQEQADARHAQCLEQRHKLEVVDLHSTMEGAGHGVSPQRTSSIWVEERSAC